MFLTSPCTTGIVGSTRFLLFRRSTPAPLPVIESLEPTGAPAPLGMPAGGRQRLGCMVAGLDVGVQPLGACRRAGNCQGDAASHPARRSDRHCSMAASLPARPPNAAAAARHPSVLCRLRRRLRL